MLASALARYVRQSFPNPQYTYRFVFAPETIGALAYLDENINLLKKTLSVALIQVVLVKDALAI